jgi:hypothetical protein
MAQIVIPNSFSAGATIVASEHNDNFDAIKNEFNGNIDNSNIKSNAAIVDTKLAQITTASKVSGTALTGLASINTATAGIIPITSMDTGTTAGKLVSLDTNAYLKAHDGRQLTNLNASALSSGTIPSAVLDTTTFTNKEFFVSSGTHTTKAGVSLIFLTGCAGGGGGGGTAGGVGGKTGSGGSGGEFRIRFPYAVIATTNYNVIVGTGGSAGSLGGGSGGDGGITSFDAHILSCGVGGLGCGSVGSASASTGGGLGLNGFNYSGGIGFQGGGGSGSTPAGGGGTAFGKGGICTGATGNTGTGYGSGGSGATTGEGSQGAGAAGQPGFMLVEW